MDKASRLMLSLPRDLDAVLITSPENRLYFTGYPGEGVLLLTRNPFFFFSDPQDISSAKKMIRDMLVLSLDRWPALPEILSNYSVRRIAVETQFLSVAQLKNLRERYPRAEFLADGRADSLISEMRKQKDTYEIDCICAAQKNIDTVLAKVLYGLDPRRTERELEAQLEYEIRMLNGERGLASVFCQSGETCKSITLRLAAWVKGYSCRTVRTVLTGVSSGEDDRAREALLAAYSAMTDAVCPDIQCGQLEQIARQILEQSGYSRETLCFLGYGIGAAKSEPPLFEPGSREAMEPGMVCFLSLRLSVPGLPHIEIGDTFLVTNEGVNCLSELPQEIGWSGDRLGKTQLLEAEKNRILCNPQ